MQKPQKKPVLWEVKCFHCMGIFSLRFDLDSPLTEQTLEKFNPPVMNHNCPYCHEQITYELPLPDLSHSKGINQSNLVEPLNTLRANEEKDIYKTFENNHKAIGLLKGYLRKHPEDGWQQIKEKLPKVSEKKMDFIIYELSYPSLSQKAQLLIRRMSLINRAFLRDALYYVAPEVRKDIDSLILQLLEIGLLETISDPSFRKPTGENIDAFAISVSVATPLQKLLSQDERLNALCKLGNYFERFALHITDHPVDYETACEYYWKSENPQLAENILNRILHPYWQRTTQYDKTINFAEKTLRYSSSIESQIVANEWKAWAFLNQKKYDEALQIANENLEKEKHFGYIRYMARMFYLMGTIRLRAGQYDEALKLFDESIDKWKEYGGDISEANALHQMATIKFRQKLYEEALQLFERVIQLDEKSGNQLGIAGAMHQIGAIKHEQGQHEEALNTLKEALRRKKAVNDRDTMHITMSHIANIHNILGQYDEAIQFYQETLNHVKAFNNRPYIADTLYNMAIVHIRKGDYENALLLFDEAYPIMAELNDRVGMGRILSEMASVHLKQKNYDNAANIFKDALKLDELEYNERSKAINTTIETGVVFLRQGFYDKALPLFEDVLKQREKRGDLSEIICIMHNIASIYLEQSFYDEALSKFEDILKLQENELATRLGIANIKHQMASIYFEQGYYDKALSLFDEALNIQKNMNNLHGMASTLHQIASIFVEQTTYEKALNLLEEALKLHRKLDNRAGMARTLIQIGVCYYENKSFNKAYEFFGAANYIANAFDMAGSKTMEHNLQLTASKLTNKKVEEIAECVQQKLQAGLLPEIVPFDKLSTI